MMLFSVKQLNADEKDELNCHLNDVLAQTILVERIMHPDFTDPVQISFGSLFYLEMTNFSF